jgi:hypothetical protein
MGLTHILQVDADGQHDIEQAGFFFEQSVANPDAAICSYPEYDESAPTSRRKGRVVANTWAKIVTLSPNIPDSLCGFRVYPVEKVRYIMHHQHVDKRMSFDIEILVRMYWQKIPLIFYPVRVIYPKDGVSNFRLFYDNARISLMFTRLFFGMLIRLPLLIGMRMRTR